MLIKISTVDGKLFDLPLKRIKPSKNIELFIIKEKIVSLEHHITKSNESDQEDLHSFEVLLEGGIHYYVTPASFDRMQEILGKE